MGARIACTAWHARALGTDGREARRKERRCYVLHAMVGAGGSVVQKADETATFCTHARMPARGHVHPGGCPRKAHDARQIWPGVIGRKREARFFRAPIANHRQGWRGVGMGRVRSHQRRRTRGSGGRRRTSQSSLLQDADATLHSTAPVAAPAYSRTPRRKHVCTHTRTAAGAHRRTPEQGARPDILSTHVKRDDAALGALLGAAVARGAAVTVGNACGSAVVHASFVHASVAGIIAPLERHCRPRRARHGEPAQPTASGPIAWYKGLPLSTRDYPLVPETAP